MKNKLSLYILISSLVLGSFLPAAKLGLLNKIIKYDWFELVFNESVFACVVFLFALVTYFSPDRVFQSWWQFARIGIPVAFVLSLIINLELHHDPNGQWEDIFDIPALILIYSVFTIGSLWQIWKGWRQK